MMEVQSSQTNKVGADDVRQLLEYIKLIESSSLKLQDQTKKLLTQNQELEGK